MAVAGAWGKGLGKGGIHQRRAIEDAALPRNKVIHSELAHSLIHDWGWGRRSPQSVQSTAQLALNDMAKVFASNPAIARTEFGRLTELEELAKIGDHGRQPQNCNRDLCTYLGLEEGGVTLSEQRVPLKVAGGPCWKSQMFLLPHVLFAWFFTFCKKSWNARICPGRNTLKRFWDSMEAGNHPSLRNHPMCSVPNWKTRAVPLSLHGDAVPVTGCGKVWSKSMLAISWCSMLGKGSTIAFNFLIYSMFTTLAVDAFGPLNSNSRIFHIIVWSLLWLYRGLWPTHDVDGFLITDPLAGTPLAGDADTGFFGVLWGILGDLEHFFKVTHPDFFQ